MTAPLRWISFEHNHLDIGAAEAIAQSPYSKNLEYIAFVGNRVDLCEQRGWDSGALETLQNYCCISTVALLYQ